MPKVRSQLIGGKLPHIRAPEAHHGGLTVAARRMAEQVVADLRGYGVLVMLDEGGRARFRSIRPMSGMARMIIERNADLVEAWLIERRFIDGEGADG
jgi:hypothetical protein